MLLYVHRDHKVHWGQGAQDVHLGSSAALVSPAHSRPLHTLTLTLTLTQAPGWTLVQMKTASMDRDLEGPFLCRLFLLTRRGEREREESARGSRSSPRGSLFSLKEFWRLVSLSA